MHASSGERNLFLYRTLPAREELSPEGRRFYERVGEILRRHHRAIELMATPALIREVEGDLEKHRATVLRTGEGLENADVPFNAASSESFGLGGV